MTDKPRSEADEIDAIASELNHLSISRGDTEAFLVRRNDLVVRLRRLSRKLTRAPEGDEPLTTYRPYARSRATVSELASDVWPQAKAPATVPVRSRR